MKILITGGAGFVGANLASYLHPQYEVVVMDNLVRRGSEKNVEWLEDQGIEVRHGDIRNREDFPKESFFAILECAAQPSAIDGYENPTYDFTNNTLPLGHILDICKDTGAGLIFWSTNKVYPISAVHDRPIVEYSDRYVSYTGIDEHCALDGGDRSLYGCSKIMADLMIQEWASSFGIKAIVNRFSCLAGPRQWGKVEQGWVTWWMLAHHFQLPLSYIGFKGKQVRDVLFINDLCRLVEMQLHGMDGEAHTYPEVFNVGGGAFNAISLREATGICQKITGQETQIDTVLDERRADFAVYVSDTSKVQSAYGWYPLIDIEEGFGEIYEWILENETMLSSMYAPDQVYDHAVPLRVNA